MSAFRTAPRSAGAGAGRPPRGAQGRPRRIRGVAARATNDMERAGQAPSRAGLNPGRQSFVAKAGKDALGRACAPGPTTLLGHPPQPGEDLVEGDDDVLVGGRHRPEPCE